MQTLACHQVKHAGEIAGVQQIEDHQLMQIAVLSGVQQVTDGQVDVGCVSLAACDPYWDNVVLAMPFSLATQYTDLKGHSFSTTNVSYPTTGGPFDDGYVGFLGTSSIVYSDGSSFEDLKTGESNFALQVSISHDPTGGDEYGIIYRSSDSGDAEIAIMLHRDTGIITVNFYGGAQLVSTDALIANTFTFLHVERDGDTFNLYLDGVLQATDTYSGSITPSGSYFPTMGNNSTGAYDAKIKLCNLRLTIGAGRSYGVPTAPFAEVAC